MSRLFRNARWDEPGVRADALAFVAENLGCPDAALEIYQCTYSTYSRRYGGAREVYGLFLAYNPARYFNFAPTIVDHALSLHEPVDATEVSQKMVEKAIAAGLPFSQVKRLPRHLTWAYPDFLSYGIPKAGADRLTIWQRYATFCLLADVVTDVSIARAGGFTRGF